MARSDGLRVVVTGLIAQHPALGGVAWDYVQYLTGLTRLGHDVYYLEDSGQWPYRLEAEGTSREAWVADDPSANLRHLTEVLSAFGIQDRWAYRFPVTGEWFGLTELARSEVIGSADLILNVSGCLERPEEYRKSGRLVYLDGDPVFTQLRLAANPLELGLPADEASKEREFAARVEAHDDHFSFGEAFSSDVPQTNYRWRPTRQPVTLEDWEPVEDARDAFTTVMNWTSYRPLRFRGRVYGQKDLSMRPYLDLPSRLRPGILELALNNIHHTSWEATDEEAGSQEADSSTVQLSPPGALRRAGWAIQDATTVCRDLDGYRDYLRCSKGEWSVAKHGYVVGQPGWFSGRSACYLAAGRPVIVQSTGFEGVLPVGEGILSFSTPGEAEAALSEADGNWERHARAAREIAAEYFDARMVLRDLIADVFSSVAEVSP